MTKVTICMINQKGGCGKSSTCFHLAGYFAETGRSVLLVDADPQGSLSQGFLGSNAVESLRAQDTLAALFEDELFFGNATSLARSAGFERISIIPANQTLALHNTAAPERGGMRQYALRSFLQDVSGPDVVLIDCPPNLYLCTWTAMVASNFVIVPVPPEDFGTQGLRSVHQAIENARRLNPALRLLGHVVTRCDSRLLVHRAYERKLRELYGQSVFDATIPETSATKVAIACREPVTYHSPNSKATRSIRQLGAEIQHRIDDMMCQLKVA